MWGCVPFKTCISTFKNCCVGWAEDWHLHKQSSGHLAHSDRNSNVHVCGLHTISVFFISQELVSPPTLSILDPLWLNCSVMLCLKSRLLLISWFLYSGRSSKTFLTEPQPQSVLQLTQLWLQCQGNTIRKSTSIFQVPNYLESVLSILWCFPGM